MDLTILRSFKAYTTRTILVPSHREKHVALNTFNIFIRCLPAIYELNPRFVITQKPDFHVMEVEGWIMEAQ